MADMKSRRWRWSLPLYGLSVLVLLAGLAWWRLPRSYRCVARLPVCDNTFAPTAAGVLVKERVDGDYRFALRRWRDGTLVWAVTPPRSAGVQPAGTPRWAWSVSPSGRHFAVLARTGDGGGQRVLIWRDGTLTGDHQRFTPISHAPTLKTLDDGRVFLYQGSRSRIYYKRPRRGARPVPLPFRAVLFQGRVLLAEGEIPSGELVTIAPNGAAVLTQSAGGFTYACLAVHDRKLTITGKYSDRKTLAHRYWSTLSRAEDETNTGIGSEFQMTPHGRFLLDNGDVYGPKGCLVTAPRGWDASMSDLSPDGAYTLGLRAHAQSFRVRLMRPDTGAAWEWRGQGQCLGGIPCQGGRHALMICQAGMPTHLQPLMELAPDGIEARFGSETYILALHERGAGLRAAMRLTEGAGVTLGRTIYELEALYPSPDGRAIAFIGQHDGGDYYLLLFRY